MTAAPPSPLRRPAAPAGASRPDTSRPGTSLYVHVPFCTVKCGYCDFNSYVVEDLGVHDVFLQALEAELCATVLPEQPVSVFVGGGTPSLLSEPRLERLFALLGRHVDLHACPEVTMEANPESVTAGKMRLARAAGVGRVSMGVQSFDDVLLQRLDRVHSGARAREAFAELRAAGLTNVSIDLIFGVPGQTLGQWTADLEAALALAPDHVSCYSLTYEPGTRLHRDLLRGRVSRCDEEVDRAMFLHTRERLTAAGFAAYEISNFAGRGGPCRHNDHYWLQGDYVGVGPGAASHRAGVRSTNLKPVDAWARSALAGVPPVASAETLTPSQRAGEAMWLGLRRSAGVDLDDVAGRLGWPVRERFGALLGEHRARGWLAADGGRVRLTPAGVLVADRVGAAYLAPA